MTTLVLVRHGETEWNRTGRWQGHADVPLSAEGRRQARYLAAALRLEGAVFDHIYASDLGRALETAQIVGDALNLPVHPLVELREIDIGGWSGLTSDEIRAAHPDEWTRFENDADFRRGVHGETMAEFRARVGKVLDHLVETHRGQRLLIVTHGGSIRAALRHLDPPGATLDAAPIGNTSVTEITLENGTAALVRANDISHLAGALDVDLVRASETL